MTADSVLVLVTGRIILEGQENPLGFGQARMGGGEGRHKTSEGSVPDPSCDVMVSSLACLPAPASPAEAAAAVLHFHSPASPPIISSLLPPHCRSASSSLRRAARPACRTSSSASAMVRRPIGWGGRVYAPMGGEGGVREGRREVNAPMLLLLLPRTVLCPRLLLLLLLPLLLQASPCAGGASASDPLCSARAARRSRSARNELLSSLLRPLLRCSVQPEVQGKSPEGMLRRRVTGACWSPMLHATPLRLPLKKRRGKVTLLA